MGQATKKALGESLKDLLDQKPLEKITIADITQNCGVNRQTFYYHFGSIYELVEWIYTYEASKALANKRTYDTWQSGFLALFHYAQENESFVRHTYHSPGQEHLERFLHEVTYKLLLQVVEEKAQGMKVRDDDKAFIANFYQYGFVGLMLDWVAKGMYENPQHVVVRLDLLIRNDFLEALQRFSTDGGRENATALLPGQAQ